MHRLATCRKKLRKQWCVLQYPPTYEGGVCDTFTVYGRIYESGITDLTTDVDTQASVQVAVGVGPDQSDPVAGEGWLWIDMQPNVQVGYNDEYQAVVNLDQAGSFDYVVRATVDGGTTYAYCDTNGEGNEQNVYESAYAGQLTVVGAAC